MQALALEGFPVMRNFCDHKELRRLRLFEKTIDAAAFNPYTPNVKAWVIGGIGNGARIAATCASKQSAHVAAAMLLSYPMNDPYPAIGKGGGQPDSSKPLLRATVPMLFVHAERDRRTPPADIIAFCTQVERAEQPAPEGAPPLAAPPPPRVVVLPDADATFAAVQGDAAAGTKQCVLQVRTPEILVTCTSDFVSVPPTPNIHGHHQTPSW